MFVPTGRRAMLMGSSEAGRAIGKPLNMPNAAANNTRIGMSVRYRHILVYDISCSLLLNKSVGHDALKHPDL
jgi:hypothetical protein